MEKKQFVVSKSSAEDELKALVVAIYEEIWIKWIMTDLGIEFEKPIKLKCVNQATISIANDPIYSREDWKLESAIDLHSYTRATCRHLNKGVAST